MSIRIEERFQVSAPRERVWRYLSDPHQVVACLPGAELTGEESADVFLGKVKIKVGPIVASYSGKATVLERNEAGGVMRMIGEGRESGGAGSAKMTLTMSVSSADATTSDVHVSADLDIVGKIVQFGRGMIESVNKQLFKQFVECVRRTLETPSPAPSPAPSEAAPRIVEPSGGGATEAGLLTTAPDESFPPPPSGEYAVRTNSLAPTMAFPAMKRPTAPPVAAPTPPASTAVAPPSAGKPVRVIPLLFAVLRDWLKKLFGRR